jgi:predicted lipoprotein with Yx(FWY)xxD motif
MTRSSIPALLAAAISLAVISGASAAPPAKTATTAKGPTLTDAKGMSLYTFDKDSDGKRGLQRRMRSELASLEGRSQ